MSSRVPALCLVRGLRVWGLSVAQVPRSDRLGSLLDKITVWEHCADLVILKPCHWPRPYRCLTGQPPGLTRTYAGRAADRCQGPHRAAQGLLSRAGLPW